MFSKIAKSVKSFFIVPIEEKYKRDFILELNSINANRVRITSITFIVCEIAVIVFSFLIKQEKLLSKPDIYYLSLYFLLLFVMVFFLLYFTKLENNILLNQKKIQIGGILFSSFILFWCAGISLFDQLSYGQIVVYLSAIFCVGVIPFFQPLTLLLIYIASESLFVVLLPFFQKSAEILFGNYINSLTFIVFSLIISRMRYKGKVEEFQTRRIIEEKNNQLKEINEALISANCKLEKMSRIDNLTGVYNRRVFDQMLGLEWDRCQRYSIPLTLMMVDIDFFKQLNDTYGHQAGDECIKKIAEVLLSYAKRSSDIIARYGGDEFALILPHMDEEKAVNLAEELNSRVRKLKIPHAGSKVSDYVTISIGSYTIIPSRELTVKDIVKKADSALYEAKTFRDKVVAKQE